MIRSSSAGRSPGDFGGTCLIGQFEPSPDLLLPTTQLFGIPKAASYLYGTWRDEDGTMYRALRGIEAASSAFAFLFSSAGATHLRRLDERPFHGSVRISRDGDRVSFVADDDAGFCFVDDGTRCRWREAAGVEMEGRLLGPGFQWLHPWREGGGCYTASLKYASQGTFLGRQVRGFIGHEIHYMPPGRDWFNTPYGQGMEICWQQVANEYEDGTFVHATFAYGADGWGFAMIHDETGAFHATTDVQLDAVVRANGYPEQVVYTIPGQRWVWTIDRFGERGATIPGAPLGADGTCRREGDTRRVVRSLGNSDWWADGRYERAVALRQGRS